MRHEVYYEILEIINEEYPDREYEDSESKPDFKTEYAFESLTEANTFYRRRDSHA